MKKHGEVGARAPGEQGYPRVHLNSGNPFGEAAWWHRPSTTSRRVFAQVSAFSLKGEGARLKWRKLDRGGEIEGV